MKLVVNFTALHRLGFHLSFKNYGVQILMGITFYTSGSYGLFILDICYSNNDSHSFLSIPDNSVT